MVADDFEVGKTYDLSLVVKGCAIGLAGTHRRVSPRHTLKRIDNDWGYFENYEGTTFGLPLSLIEKATFSA